MTSIRKTFGTQQYWGMLKTLWPKWCAWHCIDMIPNANQSTYHCPLPQWGYSIYVRTLTGDHMNPHWVSMNHFVQRTVMCALILPPARLICVASHWLDHRGVIGYGAFDDATGQSPHVQRGETRTMTRAIVIGGGIVGASAAYHLGKAGVETTLIDRHDSGHASAAGAGIISPGASAHSLPAYFPFAQACTSYYPTLVAELAELGQTDTRYDVVGELILARTDEEFANLPSLAALYNERRDGGMPNVGAVTPVDDQTAREMFPALAPIHGALHVAEAARVDGDFMRNALVAGAIRLGVKVVSGSAALLTNGRRVTGVSLDGDDLLADAVVVATGAWTNALLEPLGVSVAVEPQRGQILHMTVPDTDTSRWPILGGTGSQYMLAFGPNRVVSGATRETGSGFDVRMTPGGLQSVFNHAMTVAPGLASATVREIRIGLRPLSADGLPYLGLVPGIDGLVMATGHGASGLQLGPYSGLVAANLALGESVDIDMTPLAVDRAPASQA